MRKFTRPIHTARIVKVTLKNTRILFYASIANILVCALIFVFLLAEDRRLLLSVLLAEYCLFFILMLVYFIRILLRFNEATAIVAAYTMFTCILAISGIDIVFPRLLGAGSTWLGTLTEVISLLVAFRSFFVKAPAVSLPFKLFGAGVGLVTLPRLFVLLVPANFNEGLISITGDIGILTILLASSFILKRMIDYLKNEAEQPVKIEGEQTP